MSFNLLRTQSGKSDFELPISQEIWHGGHYCMWLCIDGEGSDVVYDDSVADKNDAADLVQAICQ